MLAQRQMENEKASASKPEEAGGAAIQEEYAKGFLKAVARFFDL
jgi:hypothetical protein